jgi:hypothetical protein
VIGLADHLPSCFAPATFLASQLAVFDPLRPLRRDQRIRHQHRDRHRPDAAGNRRDRPGVRGLGIGDIADEARLLSPFSGTGMHTCEPPADIGDP